MPNTLTIPKNNYTNILGSSANNDITCRDTFGKIANLNGWSGSDNYFVTLDPFICHNCTYGPQNSFGNYVIIQHNQVLTTLYAHLEPGNPYNLSIGDFVTPANPVAQMGSTGFSNPAHLHFEVRVNGEAVNPEPYLGTIQQDLTPEEMAGCEGSGGGGTAAQPWGDYNSAYDLPGDKTIKIGIDRNGNMSEKSRLN